jgi:hypothetical protein
VIVIRLSFWFRTQCSVLSLLLPGFLAAVFPVSAAASVRANLTWNASPDVTVTGYHIYYGGASHQYTNSVSVGEMTNAIIPGLLENTTYFFAAKAHNSNGIEGDFSNEAAFAGFTATPDGGLRMKTLPKNFTGNPLTFSLGTGAPAGATINPTNGVVTWTPGRGYASTTNYITVFVTDTVNPALSISETVLITVSDFLEFRLGATAVQAGQPNSLPLTVAASSSVTNLLITLDWPGASLTNPTLTFTPPIVAGSIQNQNNLLVIQLQTAADQPMTGTNLAAQLNFQAAPGQPSAFFSIPATTAAANTASGSAYANVVTQAGEVVVVGTNPLLRPQADASRGRTLTLFANPGATYQLQYATSFASPVIWMPLMTYQPTNVAQIVSLDAANPVIFYRLQQL